MTGQKAESSHPFNLNPNAGSSIRHEANQGPAPRRPDTPPRPADDGYNHPAQQGGIGVGVALTADHVDPTPPLGLVRPAGHSPSQPAPFLGLERQTVAAPSELSSEPPVQDVEAIVSRVNQEGPACGTSVATHGSSDHQAIAWEPDYPMRARVDDTNHHQRVPVTSQNKTPASANINQVGNPDVRSLVSETRDPTSALDSGYNTRGQKRVANKCSCESLATSAALKRSRSSPRVPTSTLGHAISGSAPAPSQLAQASSIPRAFDASDQRQATNSLPQSSSSTAAGPNNGAGQGVIKAQGIARPKPMPSRESVLQMTFQEMWSKCLSLDDRSGSGDGDGPDRLSDTYATKIMPRDELIAELHRVVQLIRKVSKSDDQVDAAIHAYFEGIPLLTHAYGHLVRSDMSEVEGATDGIKGDTHRVEFDQEFTTLDEAPPAPGPPDPKRTDSARPVEVMASPKAPTDVASLSLPDRTTTDSTTDADPISTSAEKQVLATIENAIATHAGQTLTPAHQQLVALLVNALTTATSRESAAANDLRARNQQVADLENANKEARRTISQIAAILFGTDEDKSPDIAQMVTRGKELVEAAGSSKKLQEELVGMEQRENKKEAEWREKETALGGKLKTAQTELESRQQKDTEIEELKAKLAEQTKKSVGTTKELERLKTKHKAARDQAMKIEAGHVTTIERQAGYIKSLHRFIARLYKGEAIPVEPPEEIQEIFEAQGLPRIGEVDGSEDDDDDYDEETGNGDSLSQPPQPLDNSQ